MVTVAASREEALSRGERAALLLARHGLEARAGAVVGRGGSAYEPSAEIEALLVTGAFGRRSWRELPSAG